MTSNSRPEEQIGHPPRANTTVASLGAQVRLVRVDQTRQAELAAFSRAVKEHRRTLRELVRQALQILGEDPPAFRSRRRNAMGRPER